MRTWGKSRKHQMLTVPALVMRSVSAEPRGDQSFWLQCSKGAGQEAVDEVRDGQGLQ